MAEVSASSVEQGLAAQYVRMSTEMQCYSLEHQAAAIAAYARGRGLSVVKTYRDAGRSGLTTKRREGLKALLADVRAGAPFKTLLVYDVSRWGRYQDPDEAAYYEHLCKVSGVEVVYCAEPFRNDGSPMSALVKALKRAMAAEYSRELSVKISNAKRRLAAQGHISGGITNFGLKRRVFDRDGKFVCDLAPGERKAVREHRVVFVPGEPLEVAVVQLIFWFYVEQGLVSSEIARRLNAANLVARSTPWNSATVCRLLKNDRYIGNLTFGRTRSVLGSNARPTPPEHWIRAENVFDPIIEPGVFEKAQRILFARSGSMPRDRMLLRLRELLIERGRINNTTLNGDLETSSSGQYRDLFGSLSEAYAQIDWPYPKLHTDRVQGACVCPNCQALLHT